jgi:uncharacterized protein
MQQQKAIIYLYILLLLLGVFMTVSFAQDESEELPCAYYTVDEDEIAFGELPFADCANAVFYQMVEDGLSEAYGYWDEYYVAVNDIGEVYYAEFSDDPEWILWDVLELEESASAPDEGLQCAYYTLDEDEIAFGTLSFADCAVAVFNQMVEDGLSEAYGYWDEYYIAVNDIGEVYYAEFSDDPAWEFWDVLDLSESAAAPDNVSGTLGFADTMELATADIHAFWVQIFTEEEVEYTPPDSVWFEEQSISSACGAMTADAGPFYCGGDHTMYFPVSFMMDQYSRIGDFAAVLIIAHEWAHSIQMHYGLLQTQMSIDFELQADCLAGAYANYVATVSELAQLNADDITEAMQSLFEVGDSEDTPWFDPQAHGTSEERQAAFSTGYEYGLDACIE